MSGLYDTVSSGLRALGHSKWRELSSQTGVPYSTICKLAYRDPANPQVANLEKLAAALPPVSEAGQAK